MHRIRQFFLAFAFLLLATGNASAFSDGLETISFAQLPIEAQRTIDLIRRGGPFPHEQDGRVFGNFERILPKQRRGYYHEFTVRTPGVRHRGARRIVTGGKLPTPAEYYYTDDHYTTFKRIRQ